MEIRCKDLVQKFPDAFERLRKEQSSSADPSVAVGAWINDLPDLAHLHPSPREPLRSIQPPNSKGSNLFRSYDLRSRRKSGARDGSQRRMEAGNPSASAKRGRARGRPRGSRGRGAPGSIFNHRSGDKLLTLDTAGTRDVPSNDPISGTGHQFVGVPPALVLRPTDPSSSSSRRSPTRSPTRSKGPSTIEKRNQLAFMTPAIRFLSHKEATRRGGLPPVVKTLWADYMFPSLNRSDCIPEGLKVRSS